MLGTNAFSAWMLLVVCRARVEEVVHTLERPVASLAVDFVCLVEAVLKLNVGEPCEHLIRSNARPHLMTWTLIVHLIGLHEPLVDRLSLLHMLVCRRFRCQLG